MDLNSRVSLNKQTLRHISDLIVADMSSTTFNSCLLLAGYKNDERPPRPPLALHRLLLSLSH